MWTCPRCGASQGEGRAECTSCGVIFAKLRRRTDGEEDAPIVRSPWPPITDEEEDDDLPLATRLARRLVHVEPKVDALHFGGRVVVYAIFVLWGLSFLRYPIASPDLAGSFLHVINLTFHEAGHVILMPFGWGFLISLGGSLAQVAVPLLCTVALLWKTRDPFGASIGLWWVGQNFLDLAPYIGDARALELELLGGGTGQEVEGHDWEAILTALGLLEWDTTLARLSHVFGVMVMLGALAWGGYILVLQRKRLET